MRIAYIGLHLENKIMQGGVGRKIMGQLHLWHKAGHEARLFLLTPDSFEHSDVTPYPFSASLRAGPLKFLSRELNRSQTLARLIDAVRAYRPDIIYLRYGLFAYPLLRLFSIAPVIIEQNTLDVYEYRYRGPFFYWMNRITRRWVLNRAAGLVAVSHEIARENQSFHKPTLVLANGIDLSGYDCLPAPHNVPPRLMLVATPGYNWHGVDKLAGFAAQFSDLQVDVVGYQPQDVSLPIPPNLKLHGFLDQQALIDMLRHADVEFGTLALHRKKMEEASPLKVREALAYGIPLVLPYTDTDLSGSAFDFILSIPNREDNLETHGQVVRDFAFKMQGKRADRDVVAPFIDQRLKEQSRLAFFERTVRAGMGD